MILRQQQEKLIQEAKSRISDYENSLQSLHSDRDYWKERHKELQEESTKFRSTLEQSKQNSQTAQELEIKLAEKDEQYLKLKGAYTTFRSEHLQALRDISELQKKTKGYEEIEKKYEEEIRQLKQQLLELEQDRRVFDEKAKTTATSIDEMESQLALSQIEIENLNKKLNDVEKEYREFKHDTLESLNSIFKAICLSLLKIFDECSDDLHNSTSITYPSRKKFITFCNNSYPPDISAEMTLAPRALRLLYLSPSNKKRTLIICLLILITLINIII